MCEYDVHKRSFCEAAYIAIWLRNVDLWIPLWGVSRIVGSTLLTVRYRYRNQNIGHIVPSPWRMHPPLQELKIGLANCLSKV